MANHPDIQQVINEYSLEEKRLKEMIHEYLHGMESDFVVAWQYQKELYRIQSKLEILNKLVDFGISQTEQSIEKVKKYLSRDQRPHFQFLYEQRLQELNEELASQIIRKAVPGNHELISDLLRKTLLKEIPGFSLYAQRGSIREISFTSVRGNLRITFPDMKKGKNDDGMLDYYLRILEKLSFCPGGKGKVWFLTFNGSTDEQHDKAMAVLARVLLENKIMVMSDNYVKIKGAKNSK